MENGKVILYMAITSEEKHIDINDQIQKERRTFLKKTVYAAPSLIVLGQLVRPTQSKAESKLADPWGQ